MFSEVLLKVDEQRNPREPEFVPPKPFNPDTIERLRVRLSPVRDTLEQFLLQEGVTEKFLTTPLFGTPKVERIAHKTQTLLHSESLGDVPVEIYAWASFLDEHAWESKPVKNSWEEIVTQTKKSDIAVIVEAIGVDYSSLQVKIPPLWALDTLKGDISDYTHSLMQSKRGFAKHLYAKLDYVAEVIDLLREPVQSH